jgi:threonine dehydratase
VRIPTLADVNAARLRLGSDVVKTPLLESRELSDRAGGPVYLKLESLQRTGSFKIRGALNRLRQLSAGERRQGVVAWSSGNHAQGVALAARLVGTAATIVMPADAPRMKRVRTEALGAAVVTYDRATEDREAIAYDLARKHGYVVVPAYDDPDIIAGQGTVGLEICEQMAERGAAPDAVLVPVSGGGLIAGVGLAIRAAFPLCQVFSAEPLGYDDHKQSLETGGRMRNAGAGKALCDGLLAPTPGELTWAINRTGLAGGYAVSDADVMGAVRFAFDHLKIVVEPSGAAALAAVLAGRHGTAGRSVVVVISGGNVDPDVFESCLKLASS